MVLMLPGIESGMRSGVMLLTPRQEVDDVTSSFSSSMHVCPRASAACHAHHKTLGPPAASTIKSTIN